MILLYRRQLTDRQGGHLVKRILDKTHIPTWARDDENNAYMNVGRCRLTNALIIIYTCANGRTVVIMEAITIKVTIKPLIQISGKNKCIY